MEGEGSKLISSLIEAAAPLSEALGASFIQLLRRCRKQKKQQYERLEIGEEEEEEEEESGEESEEESSTQTQTPTPNSSSKLDRFNEWYTLYHSRRLVCFPNRKVADNGLWASRLVEGKYDGQPVGIREFRMGYRELVAHEITALMSDSHQNLVRYYCVLPETRERRYIVIATEIATCNLKCLIKHKLHNYLSTTEYGQVWNPENQPSHLLLNLMRDIVSGLAHLHQLGIVHHDLRPNHVLIFKDVKDNKLSLLAKLNDMGLRRVHGEDWDNCPSRDCTRTCWRAPEHQPPEIDLNAPQTEPPSLVPKEFWHGQQKGDIFSLGCILFYCITEGDHPYLERYTCSYDSERDRAMNIKSDTKYLSLIESMPEALDLISHLLNPNPDMRPTAQEVLDHPFFWTPNKKLSFLLDACDHILELEDHELLNALEHNAAATLVGKWDDKFETTFLYSIGANCNGGYKFDTVGDLLRLIKNTWFICHLMLPREGSLPEALDNYYLRKVPKLLMEVYKVISKYCKEEEFFQKYKWSSVI